MKILFIPGLLCTHEVWGGLNLLRNEFDCYDANVSTSKSTVKMSEFARDLISQEAARSMVVMGISMGGYIALNMALQQMKQIKMLVLINTTSHAVNQDTVPLRLERMKYTKEGRFSEVLNLSKGFCFYKPRQETDELEIRMGAAIGPEAYINQQRAIISRMDLTQRVHEIKVPTLIITGKNDLVLPVKDSYELFELIEDSKLIAYSNCGHLSPLESNSIYNDVSAFIK